MFYVMLTAGFKDIEKTDDIRAHIFIRVIDAVSDPCLSREVYDHIGLIVIEHLLHCISV